jgi:pyruvate formate lyase activating enzyme
MKEEEPAGRIFNIQRHSTEDGPGLRTTLFLKGCPMRCPWCHNPEGIRPVPELVWYEVRCIGHQGCLEACPAQALEMFNDGLTVKRDRCDACGECVKACPADALEILGKRMTADEAAEIALRDRVFYQKSGGGVTLGGGEPALQPAFCASLMKTLRGQGVHVALDTCAGTGWNLLRPLVELADLVLLDLKRMDEYQHLQFTGVPLETVLDNAREIVKLKKPLWVRTPVIPGFTSTEENIRAIARFIRAELPSVERYELLAFTNVSGKKYQRLDRQWALRKEPLLSREDMESLTAIAGEEGVKAACWSGITRLER